MVYAFSETMLNGWLMYFCLKVRIQSCSAQQMTHHIHSIECFEAPLSASYLLFIVFCSRDLCHLSKEGKANPLNTFLGLYQLRHRQRLKHYSSSERHLHL